MTCWPTTCAVTLWSASVAYFAACERNTFYFALVVAAYALYLAAIGRWLLPKTVPLEAEIVLRAAGPRLTARWAVIVGAVALVALNGAAYAGIASGISVPVLTPMVRRLLAVLLWPGVGGFELLNFATYALIPGLLLAALGARLRDFGLCSPAWKTLPGTVLCLIPSLCFVGWGMASGKLTPLGVFYLVVHNFLSNGFSEEFQCRGMVLSHLRAIIPTGWAIVMQAFVFSLLHFHPNGAEERADVLSSMAGDIVLNLPVALAFGYLALRSRSLALPTALHLFNWQP
jgi:membrane protease YdiL (CAAX protease family)